jgi:ATP-dependent DNA helicase RecG
LKLEDKIEEIKGIGPAQAAKFSALGIKTIRDLVYYYPRRYEDYSNLTTISKLKPGKVSFKAEVTNARGRRLKGRLHITEAIARDKTDSTRLIWFNQPFRAGSIKPDLEYYVSGEFKLSHRHFSLTNPSIELVSDFPSNTARILSVYRETKGISSSEIRRAVKRIYPEITKTAEILPEWLTSKYKLIPRAQALAELHMPENTDKLNEAIHRLGFEEVFQLSLASQLNRQEVLSETAIKIEFDEKLAKSFIKHLPFPDITGDQRRTIWQIYQDMTKDKPMNRLVEGDVGSGKTVVATMAGLMAIKQNKQVAFMAPTELLAKQHAETILNLLKPIGYADSVLLLVGSMTKAQKQNAHKSIEEGKALFIIGTQALIQENVAMNDLALIVVDEQHRFGVDQRKALMLKAGHMPHVLSLSATPIPRSLALTLYGELDISIINEKPAGRKPIITKIIHAGERSQLDALVKTEIKAGHQVFVVCPSIKDSEAIEMKSVEEVYAIYTKTFKGLRVSMLHGKMKADQKAQVMQDFLDKKSDILVATTVIEVGVDVRNATAMVIESPERFGLAQLHQLRGRVGRNEDQGFCYLMLDGTNPPSRRLRALVSSSDGFKLAELDLNIRGPGAIYGTAQHGALDLRLAKLSDTKLISDASSAAKLFIERGESLLKYKELSDHVKRLQIVTNLN